MKRNLIYGLLISLFVCASGMVGYAQPYFSNINGFTPGEVKLCSVDNKYYARISISSGNSFRLYNTSGQIITSITNTNLQFRNWNGINDFILNSGSYDGYFQINETTTAAFIENITSCPDLFPYVPSITGEWGSTPAVNYLGTCEENTWMYSIQGYNVNGGHGTVKIKNYNISYTETAYMRRNDNDIFVLKTNDLFYIKLKEINGTKTIETSKTPFICGIQVPNINNGNSTVCISNIGTITAPTVDGAEEKGWYINDNKADNFASVQVGDVIKYYAIDDSDVESTSNEITVIGAPTISDFENTSSCNEQIDLSEYTINWNGDIGTVSYYLSTDGGTTYSPYDNETITQDSKLKVEYENVCTANAIESVIDVRIGCRPTLAGGITSPGAICNGGSISIEAPNIIAYYDENDNTNTSGWLYKDANNVWQPFDPSGPLSSTIYNGRSIRYFATNEFGTTYSNEVLLTVNSSAPDFTITKSGSVITENLGNSSNSVTYTVNKTNSCNEDDINFSLSNTTDFEYEIVDNTITVSLVDGLSLGNYESTLTVTVGTETKTETVNGSVVEWPKCYNLIKEDGVSTYEICTDEYGDILIDLDLEKFDDTGLLTIPETMVINCRNFTVKGDGFHNGSSNTGIVCKGKIICEEDFNLINVGKYWGSNPSRSYFYTTCSVLIQAKNANIGFTYDVEPFNGTWLVSEKMDVNNGNGQDIDFPECSFVQTDILSIRANISNGVVVNGHVIAEEIQMDSKKIVLEYNGTAGKDAIVTVGKISSSIVIVCNQHTVVNLCFNPRVSTRDQLGYYAGTILYNKNSEDGWSGNNKPSSESDVNYNDGSLYGTYADIGYDNLREISAYESYEDCIAEKNMASFLPIELISFNYQKANNSFVWKTASETNNDYFVVEYSRNGKDWVECSEHVSSVSTNGYSYSVKPNMSINNSLFSYFRLKQVDNNGAYSYSNVITVSFSVDNPCSEEYESSKVQIREMGGKWFRYINGELIYCENDN